MAARSLAVSAVAFDEKRLVCTVIVSVPNELKRFSTERVEPLPIEVSATTAATPMTIPRMVSTARSGLARRLESAIRSDSRATIIDRRRSCRGSCRSRQGRPGRRSSRCWSMRSWCTGR